MAKATKICKVCGSEYEYCHTVRRVPGVFRWQDVACCPEHGSTYLARIAASRATEPPSAHESLPIDNNPAMPDVVDDDGDDELFEEEFDDSAEEILIETK